ncbi:hypothetical protein FB45DRAFT_1037227 [Roridomyces roridus]|uniref:Uncharacterized protein n=1 Tax=Roridomyces roridus TaxID=1738132 RepID=A0AAD7B6U8_9AGAR|nr:hypothetical protein FB45DRAFT_1037227 [Roridomyces roridus]
MSIRRFKGRSRTWQVLGSTTGVDDCAPAPPVKKLRLGPMKLAQYQDNRAIQRKETWDVMSTTNRQNLLALQEMAAAPEFDASNAPDLLTVAGVLDGTHEAQSVMLVGTMGVKRWRTSLSLQNGQGLDARIQEPAVTKSTNSKQQD